MPAKVSEKGLLASVVLIAGALFLFFTFNLTNTRVQISEKGLIVAVAAIVLFGLGVKLFSRSVRKV